MEPVFITKNGYGEEKIKDVISICSDEEDLEYILNEKIIAIQEEISRKKKLVNKISKAIKINGKETR